MKTKFEDRQVRLFISSTFRGMGNEREVLVRHVFPEIRRRCFERGVDFVEVDLRWGITEDQVNRGNAVPLCFQQIDKCYPYFLGLLDEYYGSTIPPEQRKIACAGYPWIEYHLDRSITELEILYALFYSYSDPKRSRSVKRQAVAEKALFYFRDPHYADRLPEKERQDYIESSPVNRAKQQNLKQRLRDHGCHITEYQQPIDLKALVLEQLWERIDRDFPDTITREQREDFEHDAFAFSRQSVYIKRQADFDRLSQHATSDEPPLIIVGDSGGGKSALLANWANEYRQAHPDELVFWHFCGSSPGSSDPIALLRRIMATLKSNFQIEDDLPTTLETVKEQFGQWLAKVPRRVILIIDGLNQLENTHATRGWLPHFIPAKIRLFISTLSTNEDQLPPKSAGWQRLHLPLLTDKSARQALITEYFKSYGKTLASREMQGLLDAPQTANPLYLMVILQELRIFGDFFKLGEHLNAYLQAPNIPALYQKVLARLEKDYQPPEAPHLVENTLSLLWAARWGLRESELLMVLNVPQAIWSPLYLALQNALVSRAGLLNFFHDYLRQAVEAQYLATAENKRAVHRQLADYFEQQEIDSRTANELPYQLEQAGAKDRLLRCISDIPMFLQLMDVDKQYELWGYWQCLNPEKTMVGAYQAAFAEYEQTPHDKKDLWYVLAWLARFYNGQGLYDQVEYWCEKGPFGTEVPAKAQDAVTILWLLHAKVLRIKGEYEPALKKYQQSLNSLPENQKGQRVCAYRGLGHVYRLLGEHDKSIQNYELSRTLARTIKDNKGEAKAAYGLARIYRLRGNLKNAALRYQEASDAFKLLELPVDEAWALFGLAEVQRMKWDIEQSAKTYRVALEQYKQLGHKEGEAYADWGTGEINRFFGESEAKKGNTKVAQKYFESARKYYQSSLELCQQNDDKRSEAWALLGLAEVSRTQVLRMDGKYQDALTKYNQAYNLVVGKESVETAHALLGIAATKRLLKLADVTDIEQAYADALKIYKDRNMNYCIVYVLIDKALYSLSQFAHKQAQSYLNQAEEICVENDYTYEKSLIDKIRKDQDSSELHTLNFP